MVICNFRKILVIEKNTRLRENFMRLIIIVFSQRIISQQRKEINIHLVVVKEDLYS